MASEELLLSSIDYKVKKLIEISEMLMTENKRLKEENIEAKKKINELKIEIEKNNEEIFKFTLANTFEINFGVEEGKKRIDSLIDEIDRCITTISK